MPAKDNYHDAVVRSLTKSGWKITSEQVLLILAERRLWIDIRAEKEAINRSILVEVKGFENTPSPVEYLASAVGKYVIYTAALEWLGMSEPLYMAVPVEAYRSILSEPIGQQVRKKANLRFIVFDPFTEDIIQWIE